MQKVKNQKVYFHSSELTGALPAISSIRIIVGGHWGKKKAGIKSLLAIKIPADHP